MNGPFVVVGDSLLDIDVDGTATRLAPDAPVPVVDVESERSRPGGAALAAVLAARTGQEVVLLTALGRGEAAAELRRTLAGRVRLAEIPLEGDIPVKTRILVDDRPLVRIDRGGGRPGAPDGAARRVLGSAGAVLVSDYGRGVADVLGPLLGAAARRCPLVWDPHPRGGPPVPGARLVTPNAAEARAMAAALDAGSGTGDRLADHTRRSALLARHWQAAAVVVTLGARGALLSRGTDSPILLPAPYRAGGDPCGAGDCFAACAGVALARGAITEEAVHSGVVAAADFVASGGAGAVARPQPDGRAATRRQNGRPATRQPARAAELAAAVRARGGTVVATGGCFDLLHAGHVGLLESAARLGDCLVVCLNSDDSVRRLKGPGRPLNPVTDRASVLTGLGCVDAVAVFEEDTPHAVLRALRPHVWVKGGDYTVDALPETEVLAEWGGHALVLPYLSGRSTTALAERAAAAGSGGPASAGASA
ncbi:D-glycero-beta-D-manno-heptose 1-phosphate adenylyltransferase [Kitasatospora purpeofusca]|uniref:D-glycero-beta-D-manno-heptose 1-phosphate adenylyltransferase n=1 Tax=Kitasatospora purpeofusca TaxID=67352 RepID=UPI002A59F59B|nr:D-glycero-beta-D-manno-heptose 1-phosphate adenylyltransferase [Kitasatospora purpeofusca]MDY0814530.1 D-glycero-beta-D-manno-heptose 1-phosphate adenylyltransferase [Kitasatospora purpeofusca]